jgi:hypothetical protein
MVERRLTHQGARHSTVDHGYSSDGVFLLLHLWVLYSRWLISLRRSPSSLSSLWMASWCEWLSPNRMRDSALHQGYAHGHEYFRGEFLVGVCRHFVRELHPTSVFRMKTQYVECLVVEVDVRYKPLSRRASFSSSSSSVMMINPLELHGAYGGGADDRVEWRGRTGGSSICP